ncbi:hypothetical protein OOT46_22830 [Aquabacterium sp. A7-Y]|uniref:hypothetical protein n=1 Tax=Aquabacterium sp. A7-Y TaxID=1349605 RepID=UPI00223D7D6F|nr:hypothetical protein [Aquabacterium sp. A7-Y]MCW7540658.1 hypothetical protein [Aquabacterium sp. A7-Y]
METIIVEPFRSELEALLREHATRSVDLLIVPDIARWCAERRGECLGNPCAMAITGKAGAWGILLRSEIDPDTVQSVKERIDLFGGHEDIDVFQRLDSPRAFVSLLVLHELAHLQNDWPQAKENDCDAWAFERLPFSENL